MSKNWFDLLFDEYHARGEAMFAFSPKQVEEAFEGDLAVTYEQAQTEWVNYGAGLLIKRSAYVGFVHRMHTDLAAWEAKQPEVRVQYIGENHYDYPTYRVVSHDESAPVKVGQTLVDTEYGPVGSARSLHCHYQGEPDHALDIRVVHIEAATATD